MCRHTTVWFLPIPRLLLGTDNDDDTENEESPLTHTVLLLTRKQFPCVLLHNKTILSLCSLLAAKVHKAVSIDVFFKWTLTDTPWIPTTKDAPNPPHVLVCAFL